MSRTSLGLARFRDVASYLLSYLHICVFIRWRLCKIERYCTNSCTTKARVFLREASVFFQRMGFPCQKPCRCLFGYEFS